MGETRVDLLHLLDDRRDADVGPLDETILTEITARAQAARALGYHVALSVALAPAPVAVQPADHHAFITSCLARWGDAIGATPARRGRPRSTAR